MSCGIDQSYGANVERHWHLGRYVLPGNVQKVVLKPNSGEISLGNPSGSTHCRLERAHPKARAIDWMPIGNFRQPTKPAYSFGYWCTLDRFLVNLDSRPVNSSPRSQSQEKTLRKPLGTQLFAYHIS